ncbi:hypothetical protein [Stutzerimonas tarimensis]|uniref:DUF1573 domain-containing protein n=1 Tax=Stutzerimonas tarimensis TaxID=1507735 RepID=A0ABV7T7S3_9GAMM
MNKLLVACGLALTTPWTLALAQAQEEVEIIADIGDLDLGIEPMGIPVGDAGIIGTRAVKVINHSGQMVSCTFEVPPEDRTAALSPTAFSVNPNEETIMRVPGEYTPGQPYAVLGCREADGPTGAGTVDVTADDVEAEPIPE